MGSDIEEIRNRWANIIPVGGHVVSYVVNGENVSDFVRHTTRGTSVVWAEIPTPTAEALARAPGDVATLLLHIYDLEAKIRDIQEGRLNQKKG